MYFSVCLVMFFVFYTLIYPLPSVRNPVNIKSRNGRNIKDTHKYFEFLTHLHHILRGLKTLFPPPGK